MVEAKKSITRVHQQAAISCDAPRLIIQQSHAALSQEAIAKLRKTKQNSKNGGASEKSQWCTCCKFVNCGKLLIYQIL